MHPTIFDTIGEGARMAAYAFDAAFCMAGDALQRVGLLGLSAPLIQSGAKTVLAANTVDVLNVNIPITGEIRAWRFTMGDFTPPGAFDPIRGAFASSMNIGAVQIYRHDGSQDVADPMNINGDEALTLPYEGRGFLRRFKVIQGQTWQVNLVNTTGVDMVARLVFEMYGAPVSPDFGVFKSRLWAPKE